MPGRPRFAATCSALVAFILGGAANAASTDLTPPAPSGFARWFDPALSPFIPIPEIDTDPHSGLTLGLIAVKLRTNASGDIQRIYAPDLIVSEYFGWGTRMRIFDFPSPEKQWSVVAGLKQRVEREFDANYLSGQTRTGPLSWTVEAIYDRSGTARYFGPGNDSPTSDETTYINEQGLIQATVGYNFSQALQLAYVGRVRIVDVQPGVLPQVPSIETLFPEVRGLGTEHVWANAAMLTYDTRDSASIPHQGTRLIAYSGFVNRKLGSSVSYSYLGAEARGYWPVRSAVTLAWHVAARYMPQATDAPFWALSSLGGDRSVVGEREPLRSAGSDRYLDRNLFATGLEVRTAVAHFGAFGTHVSLELAPFLDAGKVFANAGENPVSNLHAAGGLGIRAIAAPFVVGYVDIGFGNNRTAVFSGINYPF